MVDVTISPNVALSVFQFLRDKSHYINLNWDENEKVPNAFL